jgi:hypothetical protein
MNFVRCLVATTSGQVAYTLPEIVERIDRPCRDDTWTDTTTVNAPAGRRFYTAVWTGAEMIVWGGLGGGGRSLNTGGKYRLQPPQPPITVIQPNGAEKSGLSELSNTSSGTETLNRLITG